MKSVRLLPCRRAARSMSSRWARGVRRFMTVDQVALLTAALRRSVYTLSTQTLCIAACECAALPMTGIASLLPSRCT